MSCSEAHQADTLSKSPRECIEDVHYRIKPSRPSFVTSSGLILSLKLLLKDGENGTGRVARLELGDEGMCK